MSANLKVLVIDDDAVVGRSFDRVLSNKGYDVSTVLNGKDALSSIEENDYDVVFTDIKMPGMDGLEVTERIKARCPWTPVVVITGYGTQDNEQKASVLGANGFVRKPLTPEMIESITLKAVNDSVSEKTPAPETDVVAPAPELEAVAEAEVTQGEVEQSEELVKPRRNSTIKNIALFFASPFIALGYVIALPFVGFYMFAKLGYEAYSKKQPSK